MDTIFSASNGSAMCVWYPAVSAASRSAINASTMTAAARDCAADGCDPGAANVTARDNRNGIENERDDGAGAVLHGASFLLASI